ncbi:hypothetical protein C5B85_07200 [Pseudoclavibacter sp. AY1F1]|uniref:hypothetical protein n=1 Tax=Pseudoclavibacter sp. AY1F1 TaxID=2080583 RepID=UPI000CE884B6|nr:hypothetical protein [Pseudoclavibacter sp. AY1F1]PPF45359.1 hypothetical protein C5B85_07200 [Pseudoclavibacter sp. AY1F1]
MLLCWPAGASRTSTTRSGPRRRVPDLDDAFRRDERTLADELPPRTELVVSWPSHGTELTEGSVHPAVVALFAVLADRGLASPSLRTTPIAASQIALWRTCQRAIRLAAIEPTGALEVT